ncbi:hypothetical protein [Kitasatospora sp. NPDC088783]|uniref:hypothetical protein n=1 Tax=Kitasatospora sp. NPDC088783 TaxID=3364077 RepID=UPI00380E4054
MSDHSPTHTNSPLHAALGAADPVTGRVRASPAAVAALLKAGLAARYGRLGDAYLTPAGLAARAEAVAAASDVTQDRPATAPPAPLLRGPGACFGNRPVTADPLLRKEELARTWAAVLEVRRVHGAPDRPAPWELNQPAAAIAFALEAEGIIPSAVDETGACVREGYLVIELPAGSVRVHWTGPQGLGVRYRAQEALEKCRAVLGPLGWGSLLYNGGRGGFYLEVDVPRPDSP